MRLDDPGVRLPEIEEGEHQLGGVSKADVEQAAYGAARALGELFGGTPDPIGEYCDGSGAGKKDPAGRRLEEVA